MGEIEPAVAPTSLHPINQNRSFVGLEQRFDESRIDRIVGNSESVHLPRKK
jgi:hypothetical protein